MNSGCFPALDWRLIGAVGFGLFFYGCAYDGLVNHLGDKKDGYTSLLVVGGVLVTLAAVALVYWPAAVICAIAFMASGLPMIVGDIYRAIRRREAALKVLRENHE